MSPALLSTDSSSPHIPAWKRLGLKLKSAQPISEPDTIRIVVAPEAPAPKKGKRKRDGVDPESPQAKKLNKSAKAREPTLDTTPPHSPITSNLKRRKSVTFTPETKTEDGDSIKQLYNGWVAKHQTHDQNLLQPRTQLDLEGSEPAQSAEQLDSAIDKVLQQVEGVKKLKKEKKEKRTKLRKPNGVVTSNKHLDPAILYLKQFKESRDTWKFSKVHQIRLLKTAFDVEEIPSDYIEIFYAYIAGLKGFARTKLRDTAISIKVKDQEEFGDISGGGMQEDSSEKEPEPLLRENLATVAAKALSKTEDEESVLVQFADLTIKKRLAKRMRAERILDELTQEGEETGQEVNGNSDAAKEEDEDRETQKRLKLEDGSTQKLRRKRKQRTLAVDDSSSTDSSDSESSSDDESEDAAEEADEDSSSSSSSSSSTSDDEEDSDNSGSEEDSDGAE